MWLRMDRLPPAFRVAVPDEGDRAVLLDYLTANALQVSRSSLPPGKGREEFALICSRCHALPDPGVPAYGAQHGEDECPGPDSRGD